MLVNRARLISPFAHDTTAATTTDTLQSSSVPQLKQVNQSKQRRRCQTFAKYGFVILLCVVAHMGFNRIQNASHQLQATPYSSDTIGKNRVIAYAISLIKCGDKQSTPEGLTDAALVLRHSVHMQSSRNPASGSKYDYKMYALVHPQAMKCSQILQDVGFTVVEVQPPLQPSEIQGEYLRQNIHKEWCCGSDEFIKLHAFLLPEPVVVHVDIDFAFLKPMDDLYDAILYDASTSNGHAARARIPLEKRSANATPSLPNEIEAFVTRDWPQVLPGRLAGYQAGFLVAKRNPQVYEEIIQVIKEGNYTGGYGRDCGWGGLGYGAFVGAMAMQGIMAYYYDIIRPNTAVELNQCRYNWMGMDIKYNAQPNFRPRHPKRGHCRNNGDYCEDCRVTSVDLIYNVHYTQCRKPWNCVSVGSPGGNIKEGEAIDNSAGDLDACLVMVRKWHDFRTDLEQKWYDLTRDEMIKTGQSADYKRDLFQGHCRGDGGSNYNSIRASPESFQQLSKLYQP